MKKEFNMKNVIMTLVIGVLVPGMGYGQAALQPWGNLSGIRIEGQLMNFGTSIRVLGKEGELLQATGKERQHPHYDRQGNIQTVTTKLDSLYITETVEDRGAGEAAVDLELTARADMNTGGVFFSVDLPAGDSDEHAVQLIDPKGDGGQGSTILQDAFLRGQASGISVKGAHRQLELALGEPGWIIARKEDGGGAARSGGREAGAGAGTIRLYISVGSGTMHTGDVAHLRLTIRASGEIDREPVSLTLNTAVSGAPFDGFGGNFRLQHADMDPQVIDYCLKNMRVAWGRVEMPWALWQPVKDSDPIDSARSGRLNPRVQAAMEMAQRLSKMGIPLILSVWFPPKWAVVGTPVFQQRPGGAWGNPLNNDNTSEIYKSIADYLDYLRQHYGVEIKFFSFNESDLGINIRQTAAEHAALIKGLGAYLAGRGFKTKMLLGDNSDATTYRFIEPAMSDPDARPYIGAVSFHSWRGCDEETLLKWAGAARKLDVPLIVAEGSIDAAAWNYPAIFSEPTYAMEEIDLYIRLLGICEPLAILQWQLTSDYSPLTGGGLYGNNTPLAPTQRLWNMKQLASTPKGVAAMGITADRPAITCAALGNNSKLLYAIHLVNNGARREAVLKGLPKKLKSFRIFVTDKERGMKEGDLVTVSNGEAHFVLDAWSYTELLSK